MVRTVETPQLALLFLLVGILPGCTRFHKETHEYVYVSARQIYLHDRVAAVSNRVALVTNGEALEVLEKGKRFTKVRTPKGEIGWLEDHAIIDDKLYGQFQALQQQHAGDSPVATATLRDDLYLHVLPGRDTPHFLLVTGNTKVQLLERGMVAKSIPGALPSPKPKVAAVGEKKAAGTTNPGSEKPSMPTKEPPVAVPVVAPIPMEDWWLVRASSGHTGWLLSGRMDVEIPDEVGGYAEGQRIVGAYPIAKVMDDGKVHERKTEKKSGSNRKRALAAEDSADATLGSVPVPTEHTEYVTVLEPPHSGLPYDFDQVRVFTWSLNHHRYETAYRLHGFQGYLPVRIASETVNGQSYPTFSFQIANGADVRVDPDSGVTRPLAPRTLSFRMEGNLVRRTGADQAPIVLVRDPNESAKKKAAVKKKRR